MSEHRPVIGLTARMDPGKDIQYLHRQYTDAVLVCGGIPIIIPLADDPELMRPLIQTLDGILLTGSNTDLDPRHYGEHCEKACGPIQPLRDATDFVLLSLACERRIPLLAICYGMQSLNVFMGGSLIQDIPAALGSPIQHDSSPSGSVPYHPINIAPGSILEKLAAGTRATVNSTHHQAVGRVADRLELIAQAPDGVAEAVAGRDDRHWILGLQWHPEKSLVSDKLSKAIFDKFLEQCRGTRL